MQNNLLFQTQEICYRISNKVNYILLGWLGGHQEKFHRGSKVAFEMAFKQ